MMQIWKSLMSIYKLIYSCKYHHRWSANHKDINCYWHAKIVIKMMDYFNHWIDRFILEIAIICLYKRILILLFLGNNLIFSPWIGDYLQSVCQFWSCLLWLIPDNELMLHTGEVEKVMGESNKNIHCSFSNCKFGLYFFWIWFINPRMKCL
jgi:hypothetical protein